MNNSLETLPPLSKERLEWTLILAYLAGVNESRNRTLTYADEEPK